MKPIRVRWFPALLGVLLALAPTAALGEDLAALLARGEVERAVAEAPDAAALLEATLVAGDATRLAVVREVVQLRGVLREPAEAAAWLLGFSARRSGDGDALEGAGYLLLREGRAKEAVAALEEARARRETGWTLAYLADAHRRAGGLDAAAGVLRAALAREDAPRPFVEEVALALAVRLRGGRDRSYADLLDAAGLALRAALWLAEDAGLEREEATGSELRRRALPLFRRGLSADAPAEAWEAAAQCAEGDERFAWLSAAVAAGRDPLDPARHACPSAVLALGRMCAERGRPVAALSLAQERLRYSECPAAWDLIESLPPDLRAP